MSPASLPAVAGLSRRRFLQLGASSAAALTAGPMEASPVAAATLVKAAPASPAAPSTSDLASLRASQEGGSDTALLLTRRLLDQVERIDRAGPHLRSVLALNPEAEAQAAALDRERAAGRPRGPLHGVPLLLKDNFDTGDRMPTTAGSLALTAAPAARDSTVAARLRAAGAVLLGKTNLSEWANFRSTRSSSGWSAVGGQTRNPHVLDRNPCGSSSGSGAAVAAGLCAVAIGTETDGSIVCPCNANGVVGIKPTVGLVSRAGIVPIAHSQDTAGPMARSVADAAAVLSVIAGADGVDAATAAAAGHVHTDYGAFCTDGDLRGLRLGAARNLLGFHEAVDASFETALSALRELGATVVDVELPHRDDYDDTEFEVLLCEFKADLDAYLATRRGLPVESLADLIEFNRSEAAREMAFFQQEIFEQAQEKGGLRETAYLEALATNRRLARDEGIDAALGAHRLDALLAATGGPAWPTDPVTGDHFLGGCSQAAAVAGYPHVTVPMGAVFDLPVNLSVFGTAWSEPTLIRIANAFERETRARRAPRYLPTLDLEAGHG